MSLIEPAPCQSANTPWARGLRVKIECFYYWKGNKLPKESFLRDLTVRMKSWQLLRPLFCYRKSWTSRAQRGFSALDAKKMQEINMQRTEGFREKAGAVELEGSRDSWGKR